MTKIVLFVCMIVIAYGCTHQDGEVDQISKTLATNFQHPPIDARPRGLWTWVNGNYDSAEIWREIREAKAKGMGGFDIWDAPTVQDPNGVVPIGPDQVSDAFMRGVKIAVSAAGEIGFELGYIWNQSVSYIDPEHSHMALYLTSVTADGPGRNTFVLPFPHIKPDRKYQYTMLQLDDSGRPRHWDNVALLAIPLNDNDTSLVKLEEMIDLTSQVHGDELVWEVPTGKWKILRFVWSRTTETGLTPTPATLKPALDFLNPEATEIHLSHLLDLIEKYAGPLGDSPMKYLCADSYEFKGLWTPAFPQLFEDSLGYDLIKFLPALKGYIINDRETTDRFLFDFNNLRSDLVIANHYAKAKEVCNRYGIGFTSEAAGPGPPVHMDVPMESIKSSGALSFPRGEFWVSDGVDPREHLQIIKGIASASHQYDQPYVTAEAFTGVPLWANGPGDLKPFSDRAFAEGLNRIDFHTFSHTPAVSGLPGWIYSFGNIISENLIWWPKAKGFMHYLARSSYLLQQGDFVADVLYFDGVSAPFFAKPKHVQPDLGLGYDYDITNVDILMNRLSVENGKLVLSHGQEYRVLVLPDQRWMTLPVLEKIEQLLNEGATLIGRKPLRSNGLGKAQDEAVKEMADKIWGDLDGDKETVRKVGAGTLVLGKTPRQVLQDMGILPDIMLATANPEDTLDYIHRHTDGIHIYFIRNPYERAVAVCVDTRIIGKQPEVWDPVTGKMQPLTIYHSGPDQTTFPLTLEPYGSVFVIFQNPIKRRVTVERDGHLVFPGGGVPKAWPFSDEGSGAIRFLEAGKYTINGAGKHTITTSGAELIEIKNPTWKIDFQDPWGEQFQAETSELKSWTAFEEHKIKYFSGSGTYQNAFDLPVDQLNPYKRIVLHLGRVEEAAEVFVNGVSAGLVWNNPAVIEITRWVQAGPNELKIEVVNRWPNRMIGDYKLPETDRKVQSNIITLPTAWHAPLAALPSESYDLPESGLMGPVSICMFEILDINDN